MDLTGAALRHVLTTRSRLPSLHFSVPRSNKFTKLRLRFSKSSPATIGAQWSLPKQMRYPNSPLHSRKPLVSLLKARSPSSVSSKKNLRLRELQEEL